MRLWTLHPKYLDRQGLLGVWREALLAQAVLDGRTKGYRSHPQLVRFRAQSDPTGAIACYLDGIYQEAASRGYHFDRRKYVLGKAPAQIPATSGQMAFERAHLLAKLEKRSPQDHARLQALQVFAPHPSFKIVPGETEDWERGSKKQENRTAKLVKKPMGSLVPHPAGPARTGA